ncbi:unnamed protein product [Pleuronectes platessa]|uniref:Uncharacterized protein n=1 Tax=Pleuronectes platessa TaxID=8262 RepID=A0A9N7YF10_PLEPL|nr:unnamed protein product [Pleuronectes platessa]
METAGHPGIEAHCLPPGPLHSRGLSVKAGNFPLKLCQLSGVSRCPRPQHLLPIPSGLLTSIPLFLPCALLLSLCGSLPSPSDPLLEIRCPLIPRSPSCSRAPWRRRGVALSAATRGSRAGLTATGPAPWNNGRHEGVHPSLSRSHPSLPPSAPPSLTSDMYQTERLPQDAAPPVSSSRFQPFSTSPCTEQPAAATPSPSISVTALHHHHHHHQYPPPRAPPSQPILLRLHNSLRRGVSITAFGGGIDYSVGTRSAKGEAHIVDDELQSHGHVLSHCHPVRLAPGINPAAPSINASDQGKEGDLLPFWEAVSDSHFPLLHILPLCRHPPRLRHPTTILMNSRPHEGEQPISPPRLR